MTSTPPHPTRPDPALSMYSPKAPPSVSGATAFDDRQSDGGDSRVTILSPSNRFGVPAPRRPFGTPTHNNTPNQQHMRRDSGFTTPPTAALSASGDAIGVARSPPPQGALPPLTTTRSFGFSASPRPEASFVPLPNDLEAEASGGLRTVSNPATVLSRISKHVRNRGGGSHVEAEELTDMIPHGRTEAPAPVPAIAMDMDRDSVTFKTETCLEDVPVIKPHQRKHLNGSDGPSTQPEAFEGGRPVPPSGIRAARLGDTAGDAAPPYRGEDTKWTLVDNRIAGVWLLLLVVYNVGVFAMGVASWRVASNIPSKANALPSSSGSGSGAHVGTTLSPAISDGPCGSVIPQVLIAIAFFTVVFAVLMVGWLFFFGLLVLPKLQQYRPGVAQVPFKVLSVFTPFVGYTALVVLSLTVAVGVCLYGLSLTPEANSYAENVCGSPFTTLKAVSISLVATTAALIVAYACHSAFLNRKAKKLNRQAFDTHIRTQVVRY